MPLGALAGVGPDDEVESTGGPLASARRATRLLGRVVDGLGRPLDGGAPASRASSSRRPRSLRARSSAARARAARDRRARARRPAHPGRGQRVGLFAGSGVGKSTLLGAIARGADRRTSSSSRSSASAGARWASSSSVRSGPRGFEERRRRRDERRRRARAPPRRAGGHGVRRALPRRRARVLLLVDSVTRFARAQREVGLAAGEPPRAAATRRASSRCSRAPRAVRPVRARLITAIYTVLVEGGDMDEPIADEVRGILDGHVVLDRPSRRAGATPRST
jgi:flagellar biosynthesis/type III secretory pathway ATPase